MNPNVPTKRTDEERTADQQATTLLVAAAYEMDGSYADFDQICEGIWENLDLTSFTALVASMGAAHSAYMKINGLTTAEDRASFIMHVENDMKAIDDD